jgi:hypothetical protein
MYNYYRGCAENGGKQPLTSNHVVSGSNPSGGANFSMAYNVPENCTLLLKPLFQFKSEFQGSHGVAMIKKSCFVTFLSRRDSF